MKRFLAPLLIAFVAQVAWSYDPTDVTAQLNKKSPKLDGVGIEEKLGGQVDPGLTFTDDQGQLVTLGKYFDNKQPVVMSMVYYSCPSLCNLHVNGLTDAYKKMKWTPGQDFQYVAVSMDPRENYEVAGAKKENYIKEYGRPQAAKGWHFLTGDKSSIDKLAHQLGFNFRWLEKEQEFAHASAAMILTPGGQISRYIHGIQFAPETLKMALLEASNGKIGTIIEQVIMYCFQFDPAKNKYTIYAWRLMQLGGLIAVIFLAIFLAPKWLRERR